MNRKIAHPNKKQDMVRALQLTFSIELFARNFRELRLLICRLGDATDMHLVGGRSGQWKRHEAMREVLHLLHNFVASASTLIDHTRNAYGKLYEPLGLMAEYRTETRKRFEKDPLSQFVIDLRNMALHYRLLSVGLVHKIGGSGSAGEYSVELQLSSADLRDFSGWNAPAKSFIAAHGDRIDIAHVATEYFRHITSFHQWFAAEQERIHGSAPRAFKRLVAVGPESPEDAIVAEVAASLAMLESLPRNELSYEDLNVALAPALTLSDSRLLLLCQHDASLWLQEAFDSIGGRFPSAEPLRKRFFGLLLRVDA